jgi:hypothetical protein
LWRFNGALWRFNGALWRFNGPSGNLAEAADQHLGPAEREDEKDG